MSNCGGKAFENHPDPVIGEDGRWNCPACGASGTGFEEITEKLGALLPLLFALREQMLDRDAIFLVPTDDLQGPLGTFYGLDIMRAPGLLAPMIALPGLMVPIRSGRT